MQTCYYSLCTTVYCCVVLYHTGMYYVVLYCTVLHWLYCVRGFGVCVDDGGFKQPPMARVIRPWGRAGMLKPAIPQTQATVSYCIILCGTGPYCILLYGTGFYSILLLDSTYSTGLHCILKYRAAFYSTLWYRLLLYSTA